MGVVEALGQHGVSCPDDVSVTGYNNLSFVSRVSPPLTTVGVPLNLMGELAADALLRWMSDPTGHTAVQTLLPVDFVQRATTATVALAARTAG
jgi:LacI family transcriptional regulator